MTENREQEQEPSSVVVAARVAPHERRLAELATRAAGDVSLSAFARAAIRDRAIRVVAENGMTASAVGRGGNGR